MVIAGSTAQMARFALTREREAKRRESHKEFVPQALLVEVVDLADDAVNDALVRHVRKNVRQMWWPRFLIRRTCTPRPYDVIARDGIVGEVTWFASGMYVIIRVNRLGFTSLRVLDSNTKHARELRRSLEATLVSLKVLAK